MVIEQAVRGNATHKVVAAAANGDVSVDLVTLGGDGAPLRETDLELVGRAAAVVLGPALVSRASAASQVFRVAPLVQMVFLAGDAEDAPRLRRDLERSPSIGAHWVVTVLDAERMQPILRDAVRATLDRRQTRTLEPEEDDLRRLIIADQYLTTVLEHAHDAIVSMDVRGRVLTWNAAAERTFGWSEVEIRGQSLAVLTIGDAAALALMTLLRQAVGGSRVVKCEIPLKRKDGAPVDTEMTLVQVRDESGRPFAISAIARDLTERVRGEQRRRELAVRERTELQLRRHNEELQAADRQKNAFLAVLAHELRNPLAPVATGLDILKSPDAPAPAREASIAMMERQLAMLSRLVDDLLDISRISTGKIVLRTEVVDLAEIVLRSADSVRLLAEKHGHTFVAPPPGGPLVMSADPVRIEQVLTNLLTNAIKYTPQGGRIELAAREEAGTAAIEVRDTGIGIAPEMIDRVFEPFAQANPAGGRAQGGLGIGLTLARSLVELHGGTVAATSPGRGQGTVMSVRLPLVEGARVPVPAPQRAPEPRAAGPHSRVLVVDDNIDAADSLEMLLSMVGHEVAVARDGESALTMAQAFQPDVVLLDIGLPGISGYDVAREIRRDTWLRPPILIALTGWGASEDRLRSQAAGFDHHLVKPVNPSDLLRLLASLSSSRSASG